MPTAFPQTWTLGVIDRSSLYIARFGMQCGRSALTWFARGTGRRLLLSILQPDWGVQH